MATRTLTELELRILDFAEQHPGPIRDGVRSKIRLEFGWTSAAFVQRLSRLLDDPAAHQLRPQLIGQLRRLRDEATAQRSSRSFARVG